MFESIKIMRLSRSPRSRGMTVPEDTHKWYEFVYYISTHGALTLDGREYEIKPGRFTMTRPNTLHSEVHTADGTVFFCIFECEDEFDNSVFDDDSEHTMLRLCESLASEYRRPRLYSEELQGLLLRELLIRVKRLEADGAELSHDIEYAAECIEAGFRDNLSLQSLAAEIGYGYDYFHHRFRDRYGCSPKQYQTRCRINCAKGLLLSGRYNCTEVAYLSGFSDSAQFAAIFKRECGVTPTEFARVGGHMTEKL